MAQATPPKKTLINIENCGASALIGRVEAHSPW
jgi:hypothetical protein